MSEPLHPNLAKLAAAYDAVIARFDSGQITIAQAHAEIAQLEARDDQGIRWSIDPDSGEWIRKTATGDSEYDPSPPQYGFMTPDAFDYTANPQVFNPSDAIQLAPVDLALQLPPSGLANATRTLAAPKAGSPLSAVADRLATLSRRTKLAAAGIAVALLALVLHSCSGTPSTAPTENPPPTSTPHSPAPHSPSVHAKSVAPTRHK